MSARPPGRVVSRARLESLPSRSERVAGRLDRGRGVDVGLINPFVEGIDNVFQKMVRVQPKRGPVRFNQVGGSGATLTSLVGLSGQIHGVVVLRFPSQTALRIAGRMLAVEMSTINEAVVDAVSEIVNMVAGSAKAKLGCDPPLDLGLPTVVEGGDYRMRYPAKSIWLEVPFESAAGGFTLGLTFEGA